MHFLTRKKGNEPFIALCHEYPGKNNCKISILQRGGKPPQPALGLFKALVKLATDNPKEFVILKLENYLNHNSKNNGTENNHLEDNIAALNKLLEESGLAQKAYKLKDGWPTLGELRHSSKNIIIFIDSPKFSINSPYLNDFKNYVNQTHWKTEKLENCEMANFRPNNTVTELGINMESSIPSDKIEGKILSLVNKIKKTGIIQTTNYAIINGRDNVLKRIATCIKNNPTIQPTILCSDYIEIGDLNQITSEYNASLLKTK